MLLTILSALYKETDRERVIDCLLTLQQCFSSDYDPIIKAFNDFKGVHILEQVIVPFTEDIPVVEQILQTMLLVVSKTQFIPQLDQNNIIGICVQVLIRCSDEKKVVKLSLKIIRALCLYRKLQNPYSSLFFPYIYVLLSIITMIYTIHFIYYAITLSSYG